jgi:uncharacterized delta-60 repeat protein
VIVTVAGHLTKRAFPCVLLASLALWALAGTATAQTIAVQPDGRIVLAGASRQSTPTLRSETSSFPTIVGFLPDGRLDPGLGADGAVVDFRSEPRWEREYTALGVTSRAIFAGYGNPLARFEDDGDPDTGYGTEGTARIEDQWPGQMRTVTLLPEADGSVLVGSGSLLEEAGPGVKGNVFAQRLQPDGVFGSFLGRVLGGDGYPWLFPHGSEAPSPADFTRLPDGSLVALAESTYFGGVTAFLARLEGSGSDTGFGGAGSSHGLVALPGSAVAAGKDTEAGALATDGEGRLLVAYEQSTGRQFGLDRPRTPIVARFTAGGAIDTTFGDQGTAPVPTSGALDAAATAVAAQAGGGTLAGGWAEVPCQAPAAAAQQRCRIPFAARFDAQGVLDSSFGIGGVARIADVTAESGDVGLAVLPDGTSLLSAAENGGFALVRLGVDGRLDPSFGQEGIARAVPCQGTVAERRKAGCLSRARASLTMSGLVRGRPHGRLRLNTDNLLDPVSEVAIGLPKALVVGRKRQRLKVATMPKEGIGGKRFQRRQIKVGLQRPRSVSLSMRPGVLKRVKRVRPGHKLVFRVIASFNDGSKQRLTLRVKP